MRSTLRSSIIKLLMWSLSLITDISRSFLFFFVAGTVQVVSCPDPHRAGQVRANEINSILPSWPKGYNKTCNYANIYSYSVKKKVVRYQDALHELVDLWKWFDKIVSNDMDVERNIICTILWRLCIGRIFFLRNF